MSDPVVLKILTFGALESWSLASPHDLLTNLVRPLSCSNKQPVLVIHTIVLTTTVAYKGRVV